MDEIEIYKELGTYERHFNQMQNVCRSLASTWLLATFAGIGYIFERTSTPYGGIGVRHAASLIALAGGTGIFLLWIIDVMVYHKLLLAVLNEAQALEAKTALPKLRLAMAKEALSNFLGLTLSARAKISLFYGFPALFLWIVALICLVNAVSAEKSPAIDVAIGMGLVLLAIFVGIILSANRPLSGESNAEPKTKTG